jgi:hypothetical protein
MHPNNNVQMVGPKDKKQVYEGEGSDLWPYMQVFIQKATEVLQPFDNVYFEIINEPYSDHDHGWYEEFHRSVAELLGVVAPGKLVAINYANRTGRLPELHPNVSIVNFHYAIPEAMHGNYHLGYILGDDETGFAGQTPMPYRQEAWKFLMSGGSMFSHLDYSYTLKHPDGSYSVEGTKTPGYGGADLRKQLGFLRKTLEKNAVWNLVPGNEVLIKSPEAISIPILADTTRGFYMGYMSRAGQYGLRLPAGKYSLRLLDTIECKEVSAEIISHPGNYLFFDNALPEAAFTLTKRK